MTFYDKETLEFVSDSEKKLKDFNFRLQTINDERSRDDYARDYARVLYSSSFRRLQGKMQLLGIDNIHFFRNRLTHSMVSAA